MKICFVYPDIDGAEHYGARKYYHGLGYISAVLRQAGHETSLVYLQSEPTAESFVAEVQARAPDLLAFSSTTHQHRFVDRCAGWAKAAHPEWLIVSGGVHPTLVPEEVLANPAIDVVCVGEGEEALLDLVSALESGKSIAHIPNLWARDRESGEVSYNALRPLLTNLDLLPFADRELFDYAEILERNGGVADLVAGRGCPYNCSYCCNHALRARYRGLGKYVRFRSVSNVLAEIRALKSRYAISVLNFQDDAFTLDRSWALEFCRAYGAEFALPFWINSRVEQLDEELIRALAQAGCQLVRIGVESGNEELRHGVLKRHMSNDDFRRVFGLLHQHGIQSYSCNMIGLPGETPEMVQETIDLNRDLDPDKFQFSVFYPYPMTELHDISVREGYLREDQDLTGYYGRESVLELPTLSAEELGQGYDRFEELKYELALKRASPWRYRLYRLWFRLYGGDVTRMRRDRGRLRGWLGALRRGRAGRAGASQ
ncbi:MAG: radical SAM protein [Chloroflexi bacterium]|nr:radical SAM protein [Chloroflexota bacterium]